jgi:nucleotide-binding universal stress UspA family protein
MSNDPAEAGERPFVIVLGLDLADQESSGYAFDQAARIASRIPCSEMHAVHVLPADTSAEASFEAAGLMRVYLSDKTAALTALQVRGPKRLGTHVRRGDAAREIAQLATDVGADMIVVGTHKAPHLKSLFVGTTAARVMATTICPVFVAGPRPRPEPPHVIVIEPPCPDCVERRVATAGRNWWCARHSERHHLRHHHVYSYHSDMPFDSHDSAVAPTGVD